MDDNVTDHWSDYDDDDLEPIAPPTLEMKRELWAAAVASPEQFKQYVNSPIQLDCDMSRLLLSCDETGQNFLHMGAKVGDFKLIAVLKKELSFCFFRHYPRPKHVTGFIRDLPTKQDKDGNAPLHIAAAHDHLDFAKALIRYRSDGNVVDPIDVERTQRVAFIDISPLLAPADAPYTSVRPETVAYMNIKNHAGRCAWEEALRAGNNDTANWLRRYTEQCDRIWQQCQEQ